MNIHTFQSMGTHFQFAGIDAPLAKEIEQWLYELEARLSRFSPVSELNHFNHSPGKPVKCSDTLWEVIELAHHYYRETEGIFNPYLGRVLSGLGYDRSFENINNDLAPATAFMPKVDDPISLDTEKKEAILHPLVSVDLGGIAKGWSAQKIRKWAKQSGIPCGVVDSGGDMAIWGNADEAGWEILIENPWDSAKDLAFLRVTTEAGIATSSLIKRQWGAGSHHIIDPRTQQSSQSDLVQVTVIAPDPALSEVYTKVLLILGAEQGVHFVDQKQPKMAYILVKLDGTTIVSSNMNDYTSEWIVF